LAPVAPPTIPDQDWACVAVPAATNAPDHISRLFDETVQILASRRDCIFHPPR
jgi:hypothetical protein